jgi:putative spermidine/putrescine transport system ATP-binding protein
MSAYLSVRGVSKSFGDISVLKSFDVELQEGEFLTLLGPSGCGKSTLLRCVAGLETCDSGGIVLAGRDLAGLPPQERGIGMVFQNYALFPTMRTLDNVLFGLRMHRIPPLEARDRAMKALWMVHLTDKAKAFPHELSGGQQQRVALARALVLRPRLLLLDEPLSALDAQIRKELRAEIRTLQKSLGMTTILVTHDQEEAFSISDRICLMHEGRILQEGRPRDVYANPRHEVAARFLGNFNVFGPGELAGWTGPAHAARPEPDRSCAVAPEELGMIPCAAEEIPSTNGHLWTRGVVEDVVHLGAIRRYRVDAGGLHLTVDQLNGGGQDWLESGSSVVVTVKSESLRPLEKA